MTQDDLQIDELNLHGEWLCQPGLFFNASQAYADVTEALGQAQLRLKMQEAELALEVRADPEAYGLGKATESAVGEICTMNEDINKTKGAIVLLASQAERAKGYMEAVRHRKSALENLCMLARMNYYSDPSAPPDFPKPGDAAASRMREHLKGADA